MHVETEKVRRHKPINVVLILSWIAVTVITSLTLVVMASPSKYEIAGIKTRVSISPRVAGGSVIALPPLGEIRAQTHSIPVGLNIEVQGINQTNLEQALERSKNSREYFRMVDRDARSSARSLAVKLLALAAFGGLLGCLLLTRKWPYLLAAPLLTVALTGSILLGVYVQFDATAFAQPQITGPLGSVPFLTTSIEKGTNPLDTLREDITLTARNLKEFSAKVEAWQPVEPEKGTIRILSVSDIHNNPAGFSMVQRVSREFKVDFIIDTGDITDFGTPLEASLLTQIKGINKPYLYVPGNHDTAAILSEMSDIPNVVLLDSRSLDEKGISIYGVGDPLSKNALVNPVSDKEMDKLAQNLKDSVDSMKKKPDIVAVHDRRMAERIIGDVPLILSGHTHRAGIEQRDETVMINPGTTGASGLDLLKGKRSPDQIYTASIIYINSKTKELVAVDSIQVTGLTGEFMLTRKLIQ